MRARVIIGIIFILLGIAAFTGINLGRFIGPLILIFIGWVIITGSHRQRNENDNANAVETTQEDLNEVLIFSGTERRIVSKNFTGGRIIAIFGGADIDISRVTTKEKDLKLELVAVFGGVKVRVPNNWIIRSDAIGILGGVDNRTHAQEKGVLVHVTGAAVFGGIEMIS